MNFLEAIKETLVNSNSNISITENGAIGYKTTGKKILDLTFQIASLRKMEESEIREKFIEAYLEEPLVAALWIFYARDIREGLGERKLFRSCLTFLAEKTKDIKAFIQLIPEYGRFDDLFILFENGYKKEVGEFIKEQLQKDIENKNNNKPISLLAKWLKSENTSSPASKKLANEIRKTLGMTHEDYRKTLSSLRAYLNVVEVKMSAKKFDEIDYDEVPSKASLNYKDAFKRHDNERYSEFINQVNKGEAKINAGVLYPHEIVAKYNTGWSFWSNPTIKEDPSIEALWKNLPDLVQNDEGTLVVADGSGSMEDRISNNIRAIDVANSLALYFAQRAKGAFKDTYITFSRNPQLVKVGSGKLCTDLEITMKHNECANTNIKATFDLILKTAIDNKMKQEELPKNILIISDMEFDRGSSYYGDALFKEIEQEFKNNGYKMPRLSFWNVNSRTNTIPVRENELGVSLVSGFSVNILKMVLNGEFDPYKNLLSTLFVERYEKVISIF